MKPLKFTGIAFPTVGLISVGLLMGLRSSAQTLPCVETNGVKYVQPPQVDGGWDVRASRQAIVLADDFPCATTGPITDIHVWGSWLGDVNATITNFWLGIYDDVPAVTNAAGQVVVPSHPGTNLLWQQSFGPGQFSEAPVATGSELFFDPAANEILGTDTAVWYYCFYPTNPFVQQGTAANPAIYWLALRAQIGEPTGLFGWKTSFVPFNDAAVWGTVAGGLPIGDWKSMTNLQTLQPINLAFKLTTPTNEPSPCCPETNGVKWVQRPDLNKGIDLNASQDFVLADDFRCTNSGLITDIHLWGSWQSDVVDPAATFTLAIWSDVPVGPGSGFSHPGALLWSQTFGPGQYALCPFTNLVEDFYLGDGIGLLGQSTNLYYLCFDMTDPANTFRQTGTPNTPTNYWLSVSVQSSPTAALPFGWKTSADAYNDTAVWAVPGPFPPPAAWKPINNPSGTGPLDLAFKITTSTNPPTGDGCLETNGTKYVQWPNLNNGYDVWDSGLWVLADDFICTNNGPVTDIHIWGSWLNDLAITNVTFRLAIYDDVPVGPDNSFSHPGSLKWQESFAPGRYARSFWGVGTESFLDPGPPAIMGPDSNVWYYCFYPTNVFVQEGGAAAPRIYWLVVYAELPSGINQRFGWKTTTNIQTDISVHGSWPGAMPPANWPWEPTRDPAGAPLDLAFKITTGPEPPPQACIETNATKYVQWPNLFGGYDVWNSNIRPPNVADGPWVLADDFFCTDSGPISDLHLWGSWWNDQVATNALTFWLALYDDVPVSPTNTFSHPGNLLWQQWFAPGQYTETFWSFGQEYFLNPGPPQIVGDDQQVWYYCFYPTNPFVQTGSTANPRVYWLVAYAQLPAGTPASFGWKSTTNVQHDVSVHAPWPGGPPVGNPGWIPTHEPLLGAPLDLAFKITTDTNCALQVTCAADKKVECGSSWVFDPPVIIPNPCCTNNPTVTFTAVTNILVEPCEQIVTGTWVITDCQAQTAVCVQHVVVSDNTPPVLTCASNKVVECGNDWTFDPPTAIDACCGTNVSINVVSTITNSPNCPQVVIRTWGAVDCCTNRALCSQSVTIVDTTPPTLACPSNLVVETCDSNALVTWSITATDTCSSVKVTSSPPSGTFFLAMTTNTVYATATDACGNTNSCSFTVTVVRPVIGPMTITRLNTNLFMVTWTNGVLQAATNVAGPYTNVPGATSPYTNTTSQPMLFYRIKCGSP